MVRAWPQNDPNTSNRKTQSQHHNLACGIRQYRHYRHYRQMIAAVKLTYRQDHFLCRSGLGSGNVGLSKSVNSLLGRTDELRIFVDHESHKEIDILVLNETNLDPNVHHNENQASKYRSKTRKGGGGRGVAIYHRANFNSGPKSRSFTMINTDSHLPNCLMTILKQIWCPSLINMRL